MDVDIDRMIELAVIQGRHLERQEAAAAEVQDCERRIQNLRAGRAEDDDGAEEAAAEPSPGFVCEAEPEPEAEDEDTPEAATARREAMATTVRRRKGKALKAAPAKLTIRDQAIALAGRGEVDSGSLAEASGCSRSVARAILGGLVRRGELRRLKAGKYGVA